MKKVRLVLFLLVAVLMLSFVTVAAAEVEETTITIFHTNDIHGRFIHHNQPGHIAHNANAIGIDTVAAIVQDTDNALLVDVGDTFHGIPFVNLGRGQNAVELMSLAGYDLFTPGNHDFNFGVDRLLELEELAGFGFVSANIFMEDGSLLFDAYTTIEIAGLTLGFFGLANPYTPIVTHPANVAGLYFGDPIAAAEAAVAALQEMGVDVIIALSHLGMDGDISSIAVAEAVQGINLIIDGHSHDMPEEGYRVGDVLIAQAGEHGNNLGRVDIVVSEDGVSVTASIISREYAHENFEPCEYVAALIAEMISELDESLNEVVGYSPVELIGSRELIRTQEMPLGNIVANAMAYASGAQLALANSGGIRDSFAAGELTIGDVVTVLAFPNYVVVVDITPAQLWEALENGVSQWPADNGRFPQIHGFGFTFDGYADVGSRVLSITIDGVELDADDNTTTFTLAINDFMAAGGDGYTTFVGLPRVSEAGIMSEVFIAFLESADLSVDVDGRIAQVGPVEGETTSLLDELERVYVDGVAFVKIRFAAEAYGYEVDWYGPTLTVSMTKDGATWSFDVGYRDSFLDRDIWRVFVTLEMAYELFEA